MGRDLERKRRMDRERIRAKRAKRRAEVIATERQRLGLSDEASDTDVLLASLAASFDPEEVYAALRAQAEQAEALLEQQARDAAEWLEGRSRSR